MYLVRSQEATQAQIDHTVFLLQRVFRLEKARYNWLQIQKSLLASQKLDDLVTPVEPTSALNAS